MYCSELNSVSFWVSSTITVRRSLLAASQDTTSLGNWSFLPKCCGNGSGSACPGAGDVFLATKEAFQALGTLNGSWYLVSSVSVGAVASCNVITGIHRGFRAFLSRATPQSGISRGAEQLIWSYFRKSNRPFQLADGLTRGCVPSLAQQEHEDAPSWGKKVIPEANPWSWTRIFPLIKWNHFAFSETFLWARIKWIIIFQWCILRSECGFLMGI